MRVKCWEIVLGAGSDCGAVAFVVVAVDATLAFAFACAVLVVVTVREEDMAIEESVVGFGGI